jgi:hypothetical protein
MAATAVESPVSPVLRRPTAWPVDWSVVWVGALSAVVVTLIIALIGMAIGMHSTAATRIVRWKESGFGSLILSVFSAFLAFTVGGWVGPDLRLSLVGTPHSSRCDCVARRRDLHRGARHDRHDRIWTLVSRAWRFPGPRRSRSGRRPRCRPRRTKRGPRWRGGDPSRTRRSDRRGWMASGETDDADTPPFAGATGRVKEGEKIDVASAPSAVSRVARGGCRRAL